MTSAAIARTASKENSEQGRANIAYICIITRSILLHASSILHASISQLSTAYIGIQPPVLTSGSEIEDCCALDRVWGPGPELASCDSLSPTDGTSLGPPIKSDGLFVCFKYVSDS